MIDEYFKKHPKEKHIMEQDWKCFAKNIQGYREEQMPEPCKSFIYGWVVAREPLKERYDYAAQRLGEVYLALSREDINYEEIIEKWRGVNHDKTNLQKEYDSEMICVLERDISD